MLKKNNVLHFTVFETPLGWMGLVSSEDGLREVILPIRSRRAVLDRIADCGCVPENQDSNGLGNLANSFGRYFRGEKVEFSNKIDIAGGTDFDRKVWKIVQKIPRGQTRSYGWIARQVGLPKAARAVGNAVGKNPVPIIIPCHRVIRGDGTLGGFGGGIETKKFLLRLEKAA